MHGFPGPTASSTRAAAGSPTTHLPGGPEQRERDRAFAAEDPLTHHDWLYSQDFHDIHDIHDFHDAEQAVAMSPA